MRIGIFGGTFNPIHYGHLRAAEEVRERLACDKILFIPSGNPPLKTENILDAIVRLKMVQIAVESNKYFETSDLELQSSGKSYTVNTLQILKAHYPGREIYFILGVDAFLEIPNWRDPEKLLSLTNFAIISRPGYEFHMLSKSPYLLTDPKVLRDLDTGATGTALSRTKSGTEAFLLRTTQLAISSTEIRRFLGGGLSVRYLLPAKVGSFIISQKLYNKHN